jgi:hypothetical protein
MQWSLISIALPTTLSRVSPPAVMAAAVAVAIAQPLPGAKPGREPVAMDAQLAQAKGGGGKGSGKGRRAHSREEQGPAQEDLDEDDHDDEAEGGRRSGGQVRCPRGEGLAPLRGRGSSNKNTGCM